MQEESTGTEKLKVADEFCICYMPKPDFLFLPCMQQCACFECADAVNYGTHIL